VPRKKVTRNHPCNHKNNLGVPASVESFRTHYFTALIWCPEPVPTSITNKNNIRRKSKFVAEMWNFVFMFAVS
jgi:hypothetical protein